MTDTAIRIEGLSKQYRIGTKQQAYRTLRDSLTGAASAPFRALRSKLRKSRVGTAEDDSLIWALRDISLEIKRGEVVGIIGRNGAGKSTLLKTLSRITDPTTGYADIHGRIGSLLEVGTGFHPELTGRENIYLNGAILGMRKSEIKRKFDEMVAFAEVEKFVDTPVKHYSTGMYLRLAFAVAAHLEPEILLVDEVLAVGDAAFQKKCLGKMGDVAKEGRTILFVSHNMGSIRSLCTRGIVLDEGKVLYDGEVSKGIEAYYGSIGLIQAANDRNADSKNGSRTGFDPISVNGGGGNTVLQSREFEVSTALHINENASGLSLFCIVEYMSGDCISVVREDRPISSLADFRGGKYRISVKYPTLWMSAGLYSIYFKAYLWGASGEERYVSDKFPFDVEGESSLMQGLLQPAVNWQLRPAEPNDSPYQFTKDSEKIEIGYGG